jgi:hypothetical protein
MDEIRDAILSDSLDAVGGLAVPESYRGVVVRKDEQDMFEGLATKDKDPRNRCTSRNEWWAFRKSQPPGRRSVVARPVGGAVPSPGSPPG